MFLGKVATLHITMFYILSSNVFTKNMYIKYLNVTSYITKFLPNQPLLQI